MSIWVDTREPANDRSGFSPQEQIALLARALHREGYNDHTAGHITARQPDDTLLLNPWEITWDRLTAADIIRIDLDGNLLEGDYTVTPGVELHLAVHRRLPDVTVLVHNHPEWTLVWSALGTVPPAYDQTGALVRTDRIKVYDQYHGTVGEREIAEANVSDMAGADALFLLNHGVLVQADTVERAFVRCMSIEWRSRLAWRVQATGLPGRPIPDDVAKMIADRCDSRPDAGWPHLWDATCARELEADARVLSLRR